MRIKPLVTLSGFGFENFDDITCTHFIAVFLRNTGSVA